MVVPEKAVTPALRRLRRRRDPDGLAADSQRGGMRTAPFDFLDSRPEQQLDFTPKQMN